MAPMTKLVFTNLDKSFLALSRQEQDIVGSCMDIPRLILDAFEEYNKMDFTLAKHKH